MRSPEIIGGNQRGPQELSLERLLDAAKVLYLARGYLPLNILAELDERGLYIEELERSWDSEAFDGIS